MDEQDKTEDMLSQTAEAKERAKRELDQVERDFEDRLNTTEAKFDDAKARYEAGKAKADKEAASSGESSRGLGFGLTIAYAIIGAPLVGYGIGYLIDQSTGASAYASALCLVGAFAGIAFAVVVLNKQNNS